jgi:ABC-type phosphate transport system ATPase subunit
MKKAIIEVKNLTFTRNGGIVLRDINLTVYHTETVCLLGPSGGGKSSLLRCINRLLEPSPKTVFIDGTDITEVDVLALRRRVGMILQPPAIFPGSVADNVNFGPRLRGTTLTPEHIVELLDKAGLNPDKASQPADALSGGESQRVAIARALANEPKVLLLDEPTSALDPAATRHVEATICELRKQLGLTVLWVSHDVEQAKRVADRIYLLVDGRVVDEGVPEHLFRDDSEHLAMAFAKGWLGSNGKIIRP